MRNIAWGPFFAGVVVGFFIAVFAFGLHLLQRDKDKPQ